MAKKKNKRPNLPQETLERARAEMRGDLPQVVAAAEAPNGTSSLAATAKPKAKRSGSLATRRIPSTEELLAEYAYVLKDLRNLFILAAILLVSIIALAILLPRATG
jgi:hypothetical protein